MQLDLSDDILARAEANANECRLILAVELYADNRIDHEDACRLAEVAPAILNRELLHRGFTIQQYPHSRIRSRRNAS